MAPPVRNLLGQRFGMLVVIKMAHIGPVSHNYYWVCVCDCGCTKTIRSSSLVNGLTKSCGCHQNQIRKGAIPTHGDSYSREYRIWNKIIRRCTNPNNDSFHHYGGRGITVCDRWKTYVNFLSDMGRAPSLKHSIDRINNDGNYEPGNCRWATRKEQCNNMRTNRYLTYRGETKTLAQWCESLSLQYSTTRGRLNRGKSIDQAFNQASL